MTPPVAILCGGLATRMRPLTERLPKSLLPIAGEPFIFRQLRLLRRRGVLRAVLCAGVMGEMIRKQVGDGSAFGMEVAYSFDGENPLGTAGALKKAAPLLSGEFFVLYGDSYLDIDYPAVHAAFTHSGKDGLMTVYRNDGRFDASNVLFDDGRILAYDKRCPLPEMRHIDYGLGVLRISVVEALPEDTPVDLADVYAGLLASGQLAGFEAKTRFYEIGSPGGLRETEELFSDA